MSNTILRAAAAVLALAAPIAAGAPALAGGAPELGTVIVDRQATADAEGNVQVSGTYTCTAEGAARITADVYGWRRSAPATSFELSGIVCDGAIHDWAVTAPSGAYQLRGRTTVWGALEVCDSVEGTCPMNLFEATVTVGRTR